MIKINIFLISLIFLLNSCGFTPIHQKNKNLNFSIEKINYDGDREMNNFLKIYLDQFKNEKIKNKVSIEVNSIYQKTILSKDGAGVVTNYQLEAEITFLIKQTNKKIKITEKKIMDSNDDKFEEARFEKTVKQNFASSITNKLVSELNIN